MQELGLPARIRGGIVEAKVSSDGEWFASIAREARGRSPRERDRALYDLVAGYRQGRRGAGEAILELVLPGLLARLARFRPQPPAIDDDDLTQQLVFEILAAAMSIPVEQAAFLERRLMLRAGTYISRWLTRERRHRSFTTDLEEFDKELAQKFQPDPAEAILSRLEGVSV